MVYKRISAIFFICCEYSFGICFINILRSDCFFAEFAVALIAVRVEEYPRIIAAVGVVNEIIGIVSVLHWELLNKLIICHDNCSIFTITFSSTPFIKLGFCVCDSYFVFFCIADSIVQSYENRGDAVTVVICGLFFSASDIVLCNVIWFCESICCQLNTISCRMKKFIFGIIEHITNHVHAIKTAYYACFGILYIYKSVCIGDTFIACFPQSFDYICIFEIFYHASDNSRIFISAYRNSRPVTDNTSRKAAACIARKQICYLHSCFGICVYIFLVGNVPVFSVSDNTAVVLL